MQIAFGVVVFFYWKRNLYIFDYICLSADGSVASILFLMYIVGVKFASQMRSFTMTKAGAALKRGQLRSG